MAAVGPAETKSLLTPGSASLEVCEPATTPSLELPRRAGGGGAACDSTSAEDRVRPAVTAAATTTAAAAAVRTASRAGRDRAAQLRHTSHCASVVNQTENISQTREDARNEMSMMTNVVSQK